MIRVQDFHSREGHIADPVVYPGDVLSRCHDVTDFTLEGVAGMMSRGRSSKKMTRKRRGS